MTCALRPTLVSRSATNHLMRFALLAAGAKVPAPRFRHGQRRLGSLVLLVVIATAGGSTTANAQFPIEILHEFSDGTRAGRPNTLVQGTDGNFYGTGELSGFGTVFRVTPQGEVTVLHRFNENDGADGSDPEALLEATDGDFYGVTRFGGAYGSGGTVFRLTPAGVHTTLHSFDEEDGQWPTALIQAADGNFYGTTLFGGAFDWGTVFKLTPAGVLTTLHSFSTAEGRTVPAALLQAPDGNFYGLARSGSNDEGVVFKMAPDGTTTTLRFFASPFGNVLALAAGNLYGIAPGGVLYGMTLGGVEFLHCVLPTAYSGFTMLPDSDGTSFSVAAGSFGQPGAILEVTSGCAVTVLHAIDPAVEGNANVLLRGADGNLYGAAGDGGAANLGTVFRMTPGGTFSLIHTFLDSPEGRSPSGDLVQATSDGNFYGTTSAGGIYGRGTTFVMNAAGVVTTLHSFTGGGDGASPETLVAAGDGNFYGTTRGVPATAFRMTPGGTVTTLHTFAGSVYGSILFASDGNLYGNMFTSGSDTLIFRLSLSGVFTPVRQVAFATYGYVSNLVQAPDGNLYGRTSGRSFNDVSTVFRMSLDGSVFSPLASFPPFIDFEGPYTPERLVRASDGNLYGTVFGASGFPPGLNVFRVALTGTVSSVYQVPGYSSMRLLTQGRDLNFYGTIFTGATFAVFRMPPNQGTVTMLVVVPPSGVGFPLSLLEAFDGRWYGVTLGGTPADRYGRIIRFNPQAATVAPSSVIVTPSGLTGVKLAWSAVAGATSYAIKRATASGAETMLASGLPTTSFVDATVTRGRRYYYLVTALNEFGESVASYEVSVTAGQATVGDFDGDGRSDQTVFRPSTGVWYVLPSASGVPYGVAWGNSADIVAPGDYDGDGKTDIAVFRPSNGTWYIIPSSTGVPYGVAWGNAADVPVPGDYDGDLKTDLAVFRPSNGTWYVVPSTTGVPSGFAWGNAADRPVPGDYDGDGKTDLAVFRPSNGTWYVVPSTTDVPYGFAWGNSADVPVPGDYDGDGKTDITVFRPSSGGWYVMRSSTGLALAVGWGDGADMPVPGDFDGDGQTDMAIFRPSTGVWDVVNWSLWATSSTPWGNAADVPILSRP